MHRVSLVSSLLILTLFGLADSFYLSYTALTGGTLACSVTGLDGCNTVAQSVYSHLFGIPLGVYGVGFYGLLTLLAIALIFSTKKFLYQILAVLGVGGLIASIIFMLIQVFLIKALCLYCLGSAIDSVAICVVTIILWKRFAVSRAVVGTPVA